MKSITQEMVDNFFKEKPQFDYLKKATTLAIETLSACVEHNKILACGNGGSAADCEHIAGELIKAFALKREIPNELREKLIAQYGEDGQMIADNIQGGLKCIPLTSFCAFNTAFLNDCNEKLLFAQQVNALGDAGDVLLAISTSGNSKNVVYAVQLAKVKGMKVIGLTGEGGGKLKDLCDILINVPSKIVYKIQEMHIQFYHLLCLALESEKFDS